jgi:micrococcal nuclease
MNSHGLKTLNVLLCITVLLFLSIPFANSETLKCTRVVDGKTILLSNGKTVRLIGIASLATKHPSKPVEYNGTEESVFTRKMVEGKEVRLEYDQKPGDNKYGELFAYVYLNDGTFLNAEIIKQGYGRADTGFPFKYVKEFSHFEKEARKTKRGLWANISPRKEPKYTRERYMGAKDSTIYHLPTCALIRKVNPLDRRMFNSVKKAVDAGYVPCKVCQPPYYK